MRRVNTMSVGELAVRGAEAPVAGAVAGAEPESAPARSRAETRRRLVEAGTALFAERGLHGATSARIARRAGVASGTFYLHFRDKHALFHEIVFDAFEQLRQRQERAAAGHAPGPAEQRARLEDLVDFTEENRELIRVLFARGAESAAIAEELHERVALDIESRLLSLAAEGRAPEGLHPAAAAQARAATLIRVVAWWAAHPGRATREDIVSTLLHLDPGGLAPAG